MAWWLISQAQKQQRLVSTGVPVVGQIDAIVPGEDYNITYQYQVDGVAHCDRHGSVSSERASQRSTTGTTGDGAV